MDFFWNTTSMVSLVTPEQGIQGMKELLEDFQ